MNNFEGALVLGADLLAPLPMAKEIAHVFGATATLLSPNKGGVLVLHCEAGSFRVRPGDYLPKVFTADNTTEIFSSVAHGYVTGDGPFKVSNAGGALPAGLANTTLYWVIKLTADTFSLALSWDAAMAGTVVAISDDGTGTQTIGGVPATPGATVTDGYGTFKLSAGDFRVFAAPKKLTVKGAGASDILTAWWT